MLFQITYQDKTTKTDIIEDDALEKILKTLTTLSLKVDSMGNEIEKLKTNEVKLKFEAMTQIKAQAVGLCYGKKWQRLTISQDVVDLYKANGITNMGVPDPIPETLIALKGSNIGIILSIPNDNLQALTDPNEAYKWVVDNVISYIAQQVITKFRLQNRVKVSTNIENRLLVNTILPSESIFRKDVSSSINPIIEFLKQNNASLLANFYPYSAYIREPDRIGLRYALFTKPKANPSGYYNLFDAMLDSVYYAIENAGGGNNMEIIVSGSG
ncbi:hypothetical protein T459_28102 [Capsicum annuum]|uniref:Uncharacterized protein n=1 Tax=Capsicum annuum TaxID=4072 RepID=A0A2G2YFW4_CAPAN|nr:hypothetical protein T459_28102 [Capsicum annuum]